MFDKGHALGGRVSTRVMGQVSFDLGAQYFTARDPRFESQVRTWCAAGVCAPWGGRIVSVSGCGPEAPRATKTQTRYVGAPTMAALAQALGQGLHVQSGVCVEVLSHGSDGRIALHGRRAAGLARLGPAGLLGRDTRAFARLGAFDAVVLAMPPSQAKWLVEPHCPGLANALGRIVMDPCFALGFASQDGDGGLASLPFDGAFVGPVGGAEHSSLSWVARDASKPGRTASQSWVLHATPAWTRANTLRSESDVIADLLAEFSRLFGAPTKAPETITLMRWMLARAPEPLDVGALGDALAPVFAGGDWAHGGRVEGAFLSGLALARSVASGATNINASCNEEREQP